MARRGENIYRRKDGRWEGRYKNGRTDSGKTRYASVYGKSYSAVRALLEEKKAQTERSCRRCRCSFGETADIWLKAVRFTVKESTYANYKLKLDKHILPFFSKLRYDDLTVKTLGDFIALKLSAGLSEKYVSDMVVLIKTMSKYLCRIYGYANRIEFAALPKRTENKRSVLLTDSEHDTLRSELTGLNTLTSTGILLAMSTGLRIGELCALKWEDIDLEKSIITVSRTVQRIQSFSGKGRTKLIETSPKSRASARVIPIPAFILPILRDKKSSGSDYFLTGKGSFTEPRTLQYRFKAILKNTGLPDVNFHSLRHFFATKCISLGFDAKTLSEILGHSSTEIKLTKLFGTRNSRDY